MGCLKVIFNNKTVEIRFIHEFRIQYFKNQSAQNLLYMITYFKYYISSFFKAGSAEEGSFDKMGMVE